MIWLSVLLSHVFWLNYFNIAFSLTASWLLLTARLCSSTLFSNTAPSSASLRNHFGSPNECDCKMFLELWSVKLALCKPLFLNQFFPLTFRLWEVEVIDLATRPFSRTEPHFTPHLTSEKMHSSYSFLSLKKGQS